jgi:dUTP pyrophosphatase
LKADIPTPLELAPGERAVISTALSFEIPTGFEGQVRSRSGLAARAGIFMLNSPGIIDSDYRGIVSVVAANFSEAFYIIEPNIRIAQFAICPIPEVCFVGSSTLAETARGADGFGSTGV